ncbi:hypothetical protein AVEN_126243-1 [Araneus ventricosus]|uniref:Reverse transcriptase domain-containing protein n=1 Tax=Araneus ventricosus TaxID=182803 RepID=A0A4Y2L619_ARAVE|nr:hypothetical protein AVEN_126243-1 [Araneus ventricosus]
MTRVPFGVACSPLILAATLKHHIKKFKENSEVYEMLDSSVFVNDLFYGEDSLENVFLETRINLKKFQTNSTELKNIWIENNVISEIDNDDSKVLGLVWNAKTDTSKLGDRAIK